MYLTLISLPFIGSAAAGLLGRQLGVQGSSFIACLSMGLSAMLAIISFYEVCLCGSPVTVTLGHWFLDANWGLLFDGLSSSLLLAVRVVSFVVHLFAAYYRSHDPHVQRFFCLLSRFTGFRGILATGNNYLLLFLGWEGIGITSFLLICFWWTRFDAVRSALQALLYNRVGDTLFSIGLFVMIWQIGSVDYGTVLSQNTRSWTLVCLLLLGGARAKSAQVPLHVWLPNSREGRLVSGVTRNLNVNCPSN
jgi:NADH-ubiquinone oxidoreductase chain 5